MMTNEIDMKTKRYYTITINEIGEETRIVGGTWTLGAGDTPEEYGYTPEVHAIRDYERTIYTQHIDELKLKAVIAAVNP